MNVSKIESTSIKKYTIRINDGEVRDKKWSRNGSRYRVDLVIVSKQDGNFGHVEFGGHLLKNDGTLSLSRAREQFFSQKDWPQWLHGVIGNLA